jgi:serine/threonine-protein kinase RsbW
MSEPTTAIGPGETAEFVHRIWPANPHHLAPLRADVRRWLAPLALADDTEDDTVLATSEAASNCIEHAYLPATADDTVEVTFWTEPDAFYIEIVDHGVWQPPSSQPTGRGRGIDIMQRLIAFVLIHHDTRGTRVLLRHPLADDPPRRAAGRSQHEVRHPRPTGPAPLAAQRAEPVTLGGAALTGNSHVAPERGAHPRLRANH